MWTAYVGPLRRSRRGRCGVMLFFRNSGVIHDLNSYISMCTLWTDRAPGASIATFTRSTSRVEVKLEHRRGPAGSASPRPQQTSDTICLVPGHGQHAPAARDPVARERALRYRAEQRRAAISLRPCAKKEGPRFDPKSPDMSPGLVIWASWAKCPSMSRFEETVMETELRAASIIARERIVAFCDNDINNV